MTDRGDEGQQPVPAAVGPPEAVIQRRPHQCQRQQPPHPFDRLPLLTDRDRRRGGADRGERGKPTEVADQQVGNRDDQREQPRRGIEPVGGETVQRPGEQDRRREEVDRLARAPARSIVGSAEMDGHHPGPAEGMPPDRCRQGDGRENDRPVIIEAPARRAEQHPPAAEGQRASLPPPLPEPEIETGGSPRHREQEHRQRQRAIGGAGGADPEIARGDDEGREPPLQAGRDEPEPRGHAAQIEEQQVGVGVLASQQHRRHERAERRRETERLHVDREGDHGQGHRDHGEPDDPGRRGDDLVQAAGSPDAEIDDSRAAADERGAVGAIALMQSPADGTDDGAHHRAAGTAGHRRNPPAVEGELEQIADRHQQREDADGEQGALADPLFGEIRQPGVARRDCGSARWRNRRTAAPAEVLQASQWAEGLDAWRAEAPARRAPISAAFSNAATRCSSRSSRSSTLMEPPLRWSRIYPVPPSLPTPTGWGAGSTVTWKARTPTTATQTPAR